MYYIILIIYYILGSSFFIYYSINQKYKQKLHDNSQFVIDTSLTDHLI